MANSGDCPDFFLEAQPIDCQVSGPSKTISISSSRSRYVSLYLPICDLAQAGLPQFVQSSPLVGRPNDTKFRQGWFNVLWLRSGNLIDNAVFRAQVPAETFSEVPNMSMRNTFAVLSGCLLSLVCMNMACAQVPPAPIVIGVVHSTAHPSAESMKKSYEMAVKAKNNEGGAKGRPLQLVYAEDVTALDQSDTSAAMRRKQSKR